MYIEDLILVGNDSSTCKKFKAYLKKCFLTKDLGPLMYFLGIEVAHRSQGLFLCQRKYTLDILEDCDMLVAKPVDLPIK